MRLKFTALVCILHCTFITTLKSSERLVNMKNNKRLAFGGLWLAVFMSCARFSVEMKLNEDSSLFRGENTRNRRSNDDKIEISGNITFDKPPQAIPPKSQLKVKFRDERFTDDGPTKTIAQTLVNLENYNTNTSLSYKITASRPEEHGHYSISAVLNMGWTPVVGSDDWLRNGDYLTSSSHHIYVNVTARKNKFVKDIELELYIRSSAGKHLLLKAHLLGILLMYFIM